mgnify:CR=1 FL=1
MTALNKHAQLRKELSNPATGSNHHLRKLALSLLDDLEAARNEKDELQQGFIANQEEAREAIKYATELKEQLARAFSGREEAFMEVDEMQKSLDHTHRRRAIWRGRAEVAESNLEAAEKRIAELDASHSKLREGMAAIYNAICENGASTSLSAILTFVKRSREESDIAAGIGVKGE